MTNKGALGPLTLGLLLVLQPIKSQSQDGTWTNLNGGSWANSQNWLSGIIANGDGRSAYFNKLSLPADAAVSLNGARSIGHLIFDDQNPIKHRWFITPGTGGSLTLSAQKPTVTVLSSITTITAPIGGTAGLAKSGHGQLILAGPNTYSGPTFVNEGTLTLGPVSFSATAPLTIAPGAIAETKGTLSITVNSTGTTIGVSGGGTLRLAGIGNSDSKPDLYFGPNHNANQFWGARLESPLDLGSLQRFVYGKTGHNGIGVYGLTNADCQFAGTVSGTGGLTLIAQNDWTGTGPMEVGFALNASNTFTGPVEIRRGSLYLGHAGALRQTNALAFSPFAGHNARLFTYGNNAIVSDLVSSGSGTVVIANGNRKTASLVNIGPSTLTVHQTRNTTFSGFITDAFSEYDSSGSGSTGPLNLVKTGPARLILSGVNDYSGATLVVNGSLQVDSTLGTGPVVIENGGVLEGSGRITAPVEVKPGGKLAPGPGLTTLTVASAVKLHGVAELQVSKSVSGLQSDQLAGASEIEYGGTLVVSNTGPQEFNAGDFVLLFSADKYTGTFTNLVLPLVKPNLVWDPGLLQTHGALAVIDPMAAPLITRGPESLEVIEGQSATFSVVAIGARPLSYIWKKNGTNIAGGIGPTLTISNATTNNSGTYTVAVQNANGSNESAPAQLTVTPRPPLGPITNGLVVYLNFDSNLNAQAGTTVNGSIYKGGSRFVKGMIGAAASFTNTSANAQPNDWAISLGNLEQVYSNNFTVSFWERNPGGADGALMGNKDWASGANIGWVISTLDAKNVNWNVAGGTRRDLGLNPPFSDNSWHLVTISFNRSSNQVNAYIDGRLTVASDLNPNNWASLNAGFNTLVGSSGNGVFAATGDVDDLGIWARVLEPQEVKAIHNFGLIGKPLISAVPGDAPQITAQPISLNLTPAAAAMFQVDVAGPGPLFFQWRLNGTNIAGATNSSLVVRSTSAADQGVYSVLVYNSYGGVVSTEARLSFYELRVTGQWDFRKGDLGATVGSELDYLNDTENLTTFIPMSIGGKETTVMSFGTHSGQQGFLMRHGAAPNGGGHFVNQYTLAMDVMYPGGSNDYWRAIFQSDPFNHLGNEADFYVGDRTTLPEPNGLGIEGQFNGQLKPDVWHRVAFVVDLAAPPGQQLKKYLNGAEVGRQSLSGGIDGRYALGPVALLFTSGSGLGESTRPGYVSSIQFVNGCLSPEAIAGMGGASADKLPPGNAVIQLKELILEDNSIRLEWTGPSGPYQLQTSDRSANGPWRPIGIASTNRTAVIEPAASSGFFRVIQPVPDLKVGQLADGTQVVPTKQILDAAGQQVQFAGRPVDLVLSPDGKTIYIKNINNVLVVDALTWRIVQTMNYPGSGASMHGIAMSPDGSRLFVTGTAGELYEWLVAQDGTLLFRRTIPMPENSNPTGLATSANGTRAYVCLSIKNTLAVVDLTSGTILQQIPVGIAPWDVALSPDNNTAYVSDWGGRFPKPGESTASSAGTQVLVDARGVAASGVVSFVNLASGSEFAQVPTGLHPSDIELSSDGSILFVANANSDSVTVIDTQAKTVRENILVRPDASFPYGSGSGGLAISKDGNFLFVANGGNNAIAVVELPNAQRTNSRILGFLPTDWYPGAVIADTNFLYVVNVKGLGTRLGQPNMTRWQIGSHLGTANKITIPDQESLSKFTAQANESGRVQAIREAHRTARTNQEPVPVPFRRGEPSVFKHVVYIVKENKTYDQMFGDLPQGNGDPTLCIYPRFVTPNHHALAEQYVLLDNFYCAGVNSSDGHSWSTEGNVTDHLEKSFGGFTRSYSFGDDPLTYSSSGFIWNNVLENGLTFRNYGELDYASPSPNATWLQIYRDFTNGTRSIRYTQNIGIESLRRYSSTNVPGWNMGIPDIVRADGFIRELNEAQTKGSWETFHLLYLPNDHTGGPPTPRAQVADNDLSLGRVVEAITKSIFGSNTVIFVIEDDPQSGYDHVDGHRSICLVISPYTHRGKVISTFYNQPGVLHTMQRIMGLSPMNQQDAMAPIMFECFTNVPNFTPYTCLPNNIDLAEGVSGTGALTPTQRYWAEKARKLDLSAPDRIDEDTFNRYIWHSIKGDEPYPAAFVGAHGKGLKALGLKLTPEGDDDD